MLTHFMHYPTSLFGELSRLQREMEQLFGGVSAPTNIRATRWGTFPAVNVGRSRDQVEIAVFVPGVAPDTIDLSFHEGLLTIAGERQADAAEEAGLEDVYLQERFHGPFKRNLSLPEDVNPERISAEYRNGVLQIRAPMRESIEPRKINVR
jgi:HSP20 family protein